MPYSETSHPLPTRTLQATSRLSHGDAIHTPSFQPTNEFHEFGKFENALVLFAHNTTPFGPVQFQLLFPEQMLP